MVIVFIIEVYNSKTDGTIISARRYAEGLKKRGHTIRIVSTDVENGPDMFRLKRKNIPIVSYIAEKQGQAFMEFDKNVMRTALDGADVVHCFLPWEMARKTRKLAYQMGIACTAAFHCQPDNITYNIGLAKLGFITTAILYLFRTFYDHVDHLHCPSEFIAQILTRNRYHSKMHIISNGVSSNFTLRLKPPQTALEPIEKRDVFNLLMVGRLSAEKRQDVLIKAIAQSKYRDKIQLYLAGKGPNREKLEKLGKTLPRPPVIQFLNQEELVNRIYESDLYIHTSEVDIEPLSCIEAFTCGKVPVMAHSKKSGASLFAITENSLFPAGDSRTLAARIDYWIEHPQERYEYEQKYGERGGRYNLDYSLEKFEKMLAEAKQDAATRQLMKDRRYAHIVRRLTRQPTITKIAGLPVYYLILVPVVFLINTIFFGLKIKNRRYLRETIKKNGSAITICNHVHEMDPTMCGLAILPSKPIFTSQPANFKLPLLGFFVNLFGTVSIPKTARESQIFFFLLEQRIRYGKLVHFFPECSLVRYDNRLRDFQRGAFYLSARAQTPLVPMRIVYRKPSGLYRLYKRKPLMTLIFGKPLYPASDADENDAINELKNRAFESMESLDS